MGNARTCLMEMNNMDGLKALVGARGRLPRAGFWGAWFALFVLSLGIVLGISNSGGSPAIIIGWYVIVLWVWLVVCACRARDMGKSGWVALATLIPFVGFIFWLWLGFAKTMPAQQEEEPA